MIGGSDSKEYKLTSSGCRGDEAKVPGFQKDHRARPSRSWGVSSVYDHVIVCDQ
jgi:hypothetical protein